MDQACIVGVVTGELLQREAGINLLLVPYTGGPFQAVTEVATDLFAKRKTPPLLK
jgi:hypothetical protein